MWNKNLSPMINPLYCNDRIIAIVLSAGDQKYLIVNVYLPCDKQNDDSIDEYRHSLAILENLIEEQNITNTLIGGDFNADFRKGRFWQELRTFTINNNIWVSDAVLPEDTFTYLSPSRNNVSWLDHILVSQPMKELINNIKVRYDLALFDHFPVAFKVNVEAVCDVINEEENTAQYVNWTLFKSNGVVEDYKEKVNRYLGQLQLMNFTCLECTTYNCKDVKHIQEISYIYDFIVQSFISSTREFQFRNKRKPPVQPGWNDHVSHLHKLARETFLTWKMLGCPNEGNELENMKEARRAFKKALRYIKANDENIKNEKLAESLCNKTNSVFWKEVRKVKNNKCYINVKIEGECDAKRIAEKFSTKFAEVFDDKKSQNSYNFEYSRVKLSEQVKKGKLLGLVNKNDIYKAIM